MASLTQGRSLRLLRTVDQANGFEAWRVIVREWEPRVLSRRLAVLRRLLHPIFGTEDVFMDSLLDWEADVRRFEALIGRSMEVLIRMAVVSD